MSALLLGLKYSRPLSKSYPTLSASRSNLLSAVVVTIGTLLWPAVYKSFSVFNPHLNPNLTLSACRSNLVSAALATIGLLTALRSAGFNLEPVMAVGGVSTVFIGFGSQILTANAVSGVDLARHLAPE